jgi:hypothetical protein
MMLIVVIIGNYDDDAVGTDLSLVLASRRGVRGTKVPKLLTNCSLQRLRVVFYLR